MSVMCCRPGIGEAATTSTQATGEFAETFVVMSSILTRPYVDEVRARLGATQSKLRERSFNPRKVQDLDRPSPSSD